MLTSDSFTQVRQVKYDMTPDNAIQVAVHFEQKTFHDSADKANLITTHDDRADQSSLG